MTNTALTRTRVTGKATAAADLSRGALAAVGVASTLVGLWGVACFVAGMIATGGPIALASAWISAVTGI